MLFLDVNKLENGFYVFLRTLFELCQDGIIFVYYLAVLIGLNLSVGTDLLCHKTNVVEAHRKFSVIPEYAGNSQVSDAIPAVGEHILVFLPIGVSFLPITERGEEHLDFLVFVPTFQPVIRDVVFVLYGRLYLFLQPFRWAVRFNPLGAVIVVDNVFRLRARVAMRVRGRPQQIGLRVVQRVPPFGVMYLGVPEAHKSLAHGLLKPVERRRPFHYFRHGIRIGESHTPFIRDTLKPERSAGYLVHQHLSASCHRIVALILKDVVILVEGRSTYQLHELYQAHIQLRVDVITERFISQSIYCLLVRADHAAVCRRAERDIRYRDAVPRIHG